MQRSPRKQAANKIKSSLTQKFGSDSVEQSATEIPRFGQDSVEIRFEIRSIFGQDSVGNSLRQGQKATRTSVSKICSNGPNRTFVRITKRPTLPGLETGRQGHTATAPAALLGA